MDVAEAPVQAEAGDTASEGRRGLIMKDWSVMKRYLNVYTLGNEKPEHFKKQSSMIDSWSYVEDDWKDRRKGSKKYKGLKNFALKLFINFGLSDPTQG